MAKRSAVLFLIDDTYRTGSETPLMLHRVLGTPLLRWLTEALCRAEVSRFFLVCAPRLTEQAGRCFPAGAEVYTASDENPSDRLHVFLSTAEDAEQSVLVVTGPVVYAPRRGSAAPERTANACMVGRQALMDALDETAPIGHFLKHAADPCRESEGFFSVSGPEELAAWQPILTRELLTSLSRAGVEIWDFASTWVQPGVEVGIGTVLLPGTILQGDTQVGYGCTVGPNTRIIDSRIGNHCTVDQSRVEGARIGSGVSVGPFANLRSGTVLENGSRAGAFVELKNAEIGRDAKVAHLNYVGDARVGENVNIGCGAVTANFDRVEKHATVIEKDAFIGCNTTLVAPVSVGQGAYIGAGSVITEDIPAQALGIARSRQAVRREWALRNKKPED